MGNAFKKTNYRKVLLLGLDNAGKSTILYKLKTGLRLKISPTNGVYTETIEYKNISFICTDICGRDKIRPLWKYYFANTNIVVFVVDSNDRERITIAKEELHKLMNEEELRHCHLLVFANKQDLPMAMSVSEMSEKLKLVELRNRRWYIQASCALTADGVYEGIDWLASASKEDKYKKSKDIIIPGSLELEKFGLILENWVRKVGVKKGWISDFNKVAFEYYSLKFEC